VNDVFDPYRLHRIMRSATDDPHGQAGFSKHIRPAGAGDAFPEKTSVDPEVFARAVKQFAYDFGAMQELAQLPQFHRF